MSAQDTRIQQMLKIRRTTLGFGVVQILLGISLTALSFTAFGFTSSHRIRNACPYWAGFTVFCSGGTGVIAWKHSSVMSMSLFTFFSAVCVVLQMIGTILTGDAGGLLKSLVMCEKQISGQTCKCCDSIAACRHSAGGIVFEGVSDCSSLTGLLTGLMYGLCVLTIFGSLLCFVATILGCTAVARETSRNQGLCSRHSSRRSHSSTQDRYTWTSYPTDLSMLPSYAPPVYHSVENFQDYGLSSCIVPPPVFDPTDLPPPYSSQNPSLAESQYSLSSPESSSSQHQFSIGRELTEVHFQPFHTNVQSAVHNQEQYSVGQEFTEINFQPVHTNLQSAIHNQEHQFSVGQALTDVNFQPDHTKLQSAINNQEPTVQRDEATATCGTPSGVIYLDGGDPPWDEQLSDVSQSTEHFSASDTSCLSSDFINKNFPDQEGHHGDNMDLNGHETVRSKSRFVVPFKALHHSCSSSTIQRELTEVLPVCSRSKTRASSLGGTQDASPAAHVNVYRDTTPSSSPVRGTTILSLRTRSSSLGENSIYVNSFEVMARPPPNMRVPADESSTADCHFNSRNAENRLPKATAHQVDSLIKLQGNGLGEPTKERGRHRRRRHPQHVSRHKDKRNARHELATSQGNSALEDSTTPGKARLEPN